MSVLPTVLCCWHPGSGSRLKPSSWKPSYDSAQLSMSVGWAKSHAGWAGVADTQRPPEEKTEFAGPGLSWQTLSLTRVGAKTCFPGDEGQTWVTKRDRRTLLALSL